MDRRFLPKRSTPGRAPYLDRALEHEQCCADITLPEQRARARNQPGRHHSLLRTDRRTLRGGAAGATAISMDVSRGAEPALDRSGSRLPEPVASFQPYGPAPRRHGSRSTSGASLEPSRRPKWAAASARQHWPALSAGAVRVSISRRAAEPCRHRTNVPEAW